MGLIDRLLGREKGFIVECKEVKGKIEVYIKKHWGKWDPKAYESLTNTAYKCVRNVYDNQVRLYGLKRPVSFVVRSS